MTFADRKRNRSGGGGTGLLEDRDMANGRMRAALAAPFAPDRVVEPGPQQPGAVGLRFDCDDAAAEGA